MARHVLQVVEAGAYNATITRRDAAATVAVNYKCEDILNWVEPVYDTFYRTSPEVYRLFYRGLSIAVEKPPASACNCTAS